MPASSSSDEEDLSKFQEAADSTFYNDSLFKAKQASPAAEEEGPEPTALPSLRHVVEEEDRVHNKIRVTPSFQKHVAKHLSELLDRQFDIAEQPSNKVDAPNQTRNILKAKRSRQCGTTDADESGGVRLFGASAVFLSNLNIIPAPIRRRKRGRKIASFSSNSSSDDSDSDDRQKLSAAAVSPDWILSGAATKGWAIKEGKVERCSVDKMGKLISISDGTRGYESLNEMSSSSNKIPKKSDVQQVKDDLAVGKLFKKEKSLRLESELAASFSSVLSIGSDSQGDVSCKPKKKKKKRKRSRKDHYSEDATTETTEVEDIVEERKKKVKKSKKKSKRRRTEDKEVEEAIRVNMDLPGLDEASCKKKMKKFRKRQRKLDKARLKKREKLVLKCKEKMSKKVQHLAEDLSKLMMTPK